MRMVTSMSFAKMYFTSTNCTLFKQNVVLVLINCHLTPQIRDFELLLTSKSSIIFFIKHVLNIMNCEAHYASACLLSLSSNQNPPSFSLKSEYILQHLNYYNPKKLSSSNRHIYNLLWEYLQEFPRNDTSRSANPIFNELQLHLYHKRTDLLSIENDILWIEYFLNGFAYFFENYPLFKNIQISQKLYLKALKHSLKTKLSEK